MAQDESPVHPPQPLRHVAFVRQQYAPYGGTELVLDAIMTAMAASGKRVSLIGREWSGRADIGFIRCDPPRFPRSWRERRFADAACRKIGALGAGLVQAHERIPCCDIFSADEGVHAAYVEHRARGISRIAENLLRMHPFHRGRIALEKKMFASPRLRAVIAGSELVAEEIAQHYPDAAKKIVRLPLGIDLKRFTPDARQTHRKEMREKLQPNAEHPVLLFAGSDYARKGLRVALRALAQSRTDAELWVIGRDKRPAAYKALAGKLGIGERVRMIGPVSDPLPYYGAADALILPSVYDPFGAVILEALACGLPVITSSSCGGREAAVRLDGELVQDSYDIAGFAKAIGKAFELAASPQTSGKARAIAEDYSFDAMLAAIFALHTKLSAGA